MLWAGEVEFQALSPEELRTCRSIVATDGQRVSALDSRYKVTPQPAAGQFALLSMRCLRVAQPLHGSHASAAGRAAFYSSTL